MRYFNSIEPTVGVFWLVAGWRIRRRVGWQANRLAGGLAGWVAGRPAGWVVGWQGSVKMPTVGAF